MAAYKKAAPVKGRVRMKLKKGDTVLVIAGKDKGAKGKVMAAYPERQRVLVEGVNRIVKHTKVSQTQRGSKTGGIVTQEASIDASNVMVIGPDGKPTKVGYRFVEPAAKSKGKSEKKEASDEKPRIKKVRVARRTGEDL